MNSNNDFVLVANPENRRATFFQEAVAARGGRCRVISWRDVLAGAPVEGRYVRIESAGEDWDVENALLGRDDPMDLGRIRGLDTAYDALVDAMSRFRAERFMTTPGAVAAMFDKVETKRRLNTAELLLPATYGTARTFEEVREITMSHGRGRFFVKPRHGSSASGVIALTIRSDRVLAVTSVSRDGSKLYNALKLRRYETFGEVECIIDLLGAEDELIVEDWVPKASAQRGNFDLRVVAIGNQADHVVMRLSKSPMTNLHLGNKRGDLHTLLEELGDRFAEVQATALRALAAFDGALYAGVDLAFTPDLRRIVAFEANAFGDLLPGVLDSRGRSTYEAELDAFST